MKKDSGSRPGDGKVTGVVVFFEGMEHESHYSAALARYAQHPGQRAGGRRSQGNPGGLLSPPSHAGAASLVIREAQWPFAQFSSPA